MTADGKHHRCGSYDPKLGWQQMVSILDEDQYDHKLGWQYIVSILDEDQYDHKLGW